MGLVYMVHSDLRQSLGIISLLFFGYTISLSGRVSGEQRGGATEDYNNDREFFQEEGLQGSFEIDLSDVIGMEVDNERVVDEETGDELQNIQDLQLLERLRLGRDSEDNITPFKTCRTRNI